MKHWLFVLLSTIFLFIIGLIIGPYVTNMVKVFVNIEPVNLSIFDPMYPSLSLGFLLSFCSICAGIILWAYPSKILPDRPFVIFSIGLIVTIISAITGIWMILLQQRLFLPSLLDESLGEVKIPISNFNYFSWGSSAVILTSGFIILIFLWFSFRNEHKNNDTAVSPDHAKKKVILLTIVTIGYFVYFFIKAISFLCFTLTLL